MVKTKFKALYKQWKYHLFSSFLLLILSTNLNAQIGITITGKVVDEVGSPLPGVNIYLKSNSKVGTVTSEDGSYSITVPPSSTLVFAFISMTQKEVKIKPDSPILNVTMEYEVSTLEQTVVTGIMGTRDKATFTGAVSTVSGEELKTIGNQNVLQSLRDLDPSFVILDNLELGSNPNAMADIEIRGQSGLTINAVKDEFSTSPNMPLFVLDGFEVPMHIINDLDINRVSSITILKDAGSTAIYGSKAANGVVVIETVKPKEGTLQMRYNADLSIAMPDLSSYNMMDAEEKLKFELLAGKFDARTYGTNINQLFLDEVYNKYLQEVRRGVNTYWMSEPLRTGLNSSHSISVTGGNNNILFEAGISYRNNQGIMKDNFRKTWAGNIDLTYRAKNIRISNRLSVTGYNAQESPYGDFSNWVNANPYYRKTNEFGRANKFLEIFDSKADVSVIKRSIPNPLYNALIDRKEGDEDQIGINNNLKLMWDVTRDLQINTSLGLLRENTQSIKFIPPEDTQFDDQEAKNKGEYSDKESRRFNYNLNMMITYAKIIGKHQITSNLRGELAEYNNRMIKLELKGFPAGSTGSPSFAQEYTSDKPDYYISKRRAANFLGSINYNYNMRYLLDATFRMDGSTAFGSDERFTSFWSLGAGWNIHNESFLKNAKWLNIFKIRGSYGIVGNQNIGDASSSTVYKYYMDGISFGSGAYIDVLGNPKLKWQRTKNLSLGLDLSLDDSRYNLTVDYYTKYTDPSVVSLDLRPSSGILQYPINIGYMDMKGIEARLTVSPIYNRKERIIWSITLMGSHIKSEYGGFGNALDQINNEQVKNNKLQRYRDGYSPTDIWAVPSLGIDPASGREMFLTRYGEVSFIYDDKDAVSIGNLRPDVEGNINSTFTYKKFRLSLSLRYSIGGQIFNSALFNKVENLDINSLEKNQDRRALYDRWKKPGDIAMYKDINLTDKNESKMSSRFIQDNDYLSLSSINASWDFTGDKWLNKLRLKGLRISAYSNNVFHWATSKEERGTAYPFARSISFGITANF